MHEFRVQVGPAAFRIGSAWQRPLDQLADLYRDYPTPDIPDHSVRLEAVSFLRRFIRPAVSINGDYMLPDAAPLPLAQALLAAEMAMNLQMALGWRRHLFVARERGRKGWQGADHDRCIGIGQVDTGRNARVQGLALHGRRVCSD